MKSAIIRSLLDSVFSKNAMTDNVSSSDSSSDAIADGFPYNFRLFGKLTDEQQGAVWAASEAFCCKAGQFLVRQDQHSSWVYFIESGSVEVLCTSIKVVSDDSNEIVYEENDNAIVLSVMGNGACIGELSAIDGKEHSYSVAALEEVRGHKLSVEDFRGFLHTMPVFQEEIMLHLVRLARFQSWRQEILALHNVSGAVAAQLLLIAQQYGQPQGDNRVLLPFPLRQKLLAALTGHSRESVNKVFKQFIEQGYIEKRPRYRLLITDQEALARVHARAIPRR